MEKIEPKVKFMVCEELSDGKIDFLLGYPFLEYAQSYKSFLTEMYNGGKFRIVRATTTYEVMEEAK